MKGNTHSDDGIVLDRRSVLKAGAALVAGTAATTAASANDYGDVTVGTAQTVDRANIHTGDKTVDGGTAQYLSDVWGATAHASASADDYGDAAEGWAYTGYKFTLSGDSTGTAQLTVTGDYSATVSGGWFSDATATIEAQVGEVIYNDDGSFEFDLIASSTAGTVDDDSYATTVEDQSFSVTQTVTLDPGTDYAVILKVTADVESSGGSATADAYSYNESDTFQGYASWDEITVDWL